jgi:hypothetical protein
MQELPADVALFPGMPVDAGLTRTRHTKTRIEKQDNMKVFISYGDASDQVTALGLQALGAVNGLTVYVPPAKASQPS